jgi:hypothetical protein
MARGRPGLGPKIVERLDGPDQTKLRLKVLLENLAGSCSVLEACQRLGISQARLHQLRSSMLQAAMQTLQPRPAGRPAAVPDSTSEHIADLQRQLQHLRIELHAAQLREEIALAMPHLLRPRESARKKTPPPTQPPKPTANRAPSVPPLPSNDRSCDT